LGAVDTRDRVRRPADYAPWSTTPYSCQMVRKPRALRLRNRPA
jgi:hypothetical protein